MNALPPLLCTALLPILLAACGGEPAPKSATNLSTPALQGSISPNLATGPDGQIILSWIAPNGDGHELRYAQLGKAGWTKPGTVSRGDDWFVNWADFPSVVPLSDSLWAAHWLRSQPAGGYAYDVIVSLSEDKGASWSQSFMPHTDGTPTEHGFVTLFPDPNEIGIVWLDGRKMVNEFDASDVTSSGMTLRAATFGADQLPIRDALVDELVCDCCQTDVALTSEGPIVVYRNRTTDEVRDIYVSRRANGKWQEGVRVAADDWNIAACPVNGPIIMARNNLVAVAWFTAANNQPHVKVAWSMDGGRTFLTPVTLNDTVPLGHIAAVMLESGEVAVAWHRTVGGRTELVMRRASVDGRLGDVLLVSEAKNVFAISVPQIALQDDKLILAWTQSVGAQYSVQTGSLPIDSLPRLRD